jgi:nanoRNase/pAp phosphatase (c-di-AMP/oligoRNAs hydrolase)
MVTMPEKNNQTPTHAVNTFIDKLLEFKKHLVPATSILIITHDYPDPDCLASAFGVSHLLEFWGIKSSVISFGGFVGRAENRAMIRVLNIPTVPFVLTEIKDYDRIVLVDCFPARGNVPLPPTATIHAVIDHHPNISPPGAAYFHDVRKNFGATSTIITKYLIEAGCEIPPKLATALFYGIKTDTGDMRRENVPEDVECYKYLFDIMDHRLLSRIENPDRDEEFFRILHRAVEATYITESFGYTYLGNVSTPDYIAEMADLFHSLERLEWMVCSGVFKNHIFFSIRSKVHDTAGTIAEQLAERLNGSGGGHARVAAGRIPVDTDTINKIMPEFEVQMKELFGLATITEEKLL